MSGPRDSGSTLDRVVYLGRVHREPEAEGEGPTAAVIELDLQALFRIMEGMEASLQEGWEEPREVATTDVAWTRLPSRYDGLAYEAAYPRLMANALLADVGPRFGVANQDITRRDITGLVGYEELHPMLSHESERVRRAASEALGRGPRLVS